MQRGSNSTERSTSSQTAESPVSWPFFEAQLIVYFDRVENFVRSIHDGLLEAGSAASRAVPGAVPLQATRIQGKKVLVIESVELNRVLFGRYFQGIPISIVFAKSDEEAASWVDQVDLVVRDWQARLSSGRGKAEIVQDLLALLDKP